MKKTILLILGFGLATSTLLAGGLVNLANNGTTFVTNSLTHDRVKGGNTFLVALYAAVDGTTDESLLVPIGGPTAITPIAGLFTGNTRMAPMVPCGAYGIFQVRIWEASYGNTYEAAAAAPALNGRGALLGKSDLLRVLTGDPATVPPAQPANLVTLD